MMYKGETLKYNTANAEIIYDGIKEAGINFISYLPDSWLRQVYKLVQADTQMISIRAAREDEAMAIAAGAYVGGKRPAVLMEGSGWGLSGLVLARIAFQHHIPWLIIASHTGGAGEVSYYHSETIYTVEPFLRAYNIPYKTIWRIEDAKAIIKESQWAVEMEKTPIGVLLPGHIIWEGY